MTIRVLLFASYAESVGANSLEVRSKPGWTVADVVAHVRSLPGANALPLEPLVAVNERYAKRDRVVSPGDEVAIIPPVAGG